MTSLFVVTMPHGVDPLTNRRIGMQAGTTTQAIYTYFGSRDRMLEAMFQRAIEGVEEILLLASALASSEQPEEEEVVGAFVVAARQYRAFCLSHPGRLRLLRSAGTDEGLPSGAVELRERLVATIARFGRSGTGEQSDAYEARLHMTISAIHGFLDAELDGFITAEFDPDRLFDELVQQCLVPYERLAERWLGWGCPPRRGFDGED